VNVRRPNRRVFGYWHVRPAVRTGEHVRLHQLLGYIIPGWSHVHFSETVAGGYRNPLRPGALTPYRELSAPVVDAISVACLDGHTLQSVAPAAVSGTVALMADAYELPSIAPAPPWNRARLVPSLVRWRLVPGNGDPPSPWRVAADFRNPARAAVGLLAHLRARHVPEQAQPAGRLSLLAHSGVRHLGSSGRDVLGRCPGGRKPGPRGRRLDRDHGRQHADAETVGRQRTIRGMTDPIEELRAIAASAAPPPAAMDAYLAKARERAYTVTDDDVEALKRGGIGEDEIFEQTVAAAIAEGLRRLDRAREVIA
jgi:hypothetical protein